MKMFTAIYSTKTIKNIHYSFYAKDMKEAKLFRKLKFSAKRVKIVEEINAPLNNSIDTVKEINV